MKSCFSVTLNGNNAALHLNGATLYENLTLTASFTRGKRATLLPRSLEASEEGYTLSFTDDKCFKLLTLHIATKENSFLCSVKAETGTWQWMERYKFDPYASLTLSFTEAKSAEAILSHNMNRDVWWMNPAFHTSLTEVKGQTESVLLRYDAGHLHLLPLVKPAFRTEFTPDGILLSTGGYGVRELSAAFLSGTLSASPVAAYEDNFTFLKACGEFPYPLRTERPFPYVQDGFGFCTWDAFYKNVTAEKIYKKLDEFKEKGIKIHWMLIDDGWSQFHNDAFLYDIYEDKEKFPEGLSGTIRRIKEEYGVKYVGVWHAYTAYWQGFEKDSPAYELVKDHLIETAEGYLFLAPDYDAAFAFYDKWHSYLRAQGVDFIKVDNQGSYSSKVECAYPATAAVAAMQKAIEDSAKKNFDGQILNCMGMNTESTLQSPSAPIMRMSDDYFPKREESFVQLLTQNIYNSLFQGVVHHSDFDMWWSRHEAARGSSVMRAISGGPVYVSDELGGSDPTYILPLEDEDGRIFRPEHAARPTRDCVYVDGREAHTPLKVYNDGPLGKVVAAFSMGDPEASGRLSIRDLPDAEPLYLAENYFTGEQLLFDREHPIAFTVKKNEAVLYNLYPVKDGRATLGDKTKYIGVATPASRVITIADIKKG